MRHLTEQLARIPGVVAVSLGGSRATGTADLQSDWDFGLYYRGTLDVSAVSALGWPGQVFRPGEWGGIVNGGAWLQVDGVNVDLIYRDLDAVEQWTAQAEQGLFEVHREVGYVAGIATYVPVGELAMQEVLSGDLPRPSFPAALREAAPPFWHHVAAGALHHADVHAARNDRVPALANAAQAVLCTAQGRLAARGEWALNEKRIVQRAGLSAADGVLAQTDLRQALADLRRLLTQ